MRDWLFCLLELLVYTFGVMGVCALVIEQCHRACFSLLGRRIGRAFWYATALPGAPVHEVGHAVMCLLFAHRIEELHLLPRRGSPARVEHSYHRRNPWAAMGTVWIGLGPLFSCLAVMLAVLYFLFPQTLLSYNAAVDALQQNGSLPFSEIARHTGTMVISLVSESTSPLWLRLLGWYLLLSMSLHVRLSVADLRGMIPGLPWIAALAALIATPITLLGQGALAATTLFLQRFALLQCGLFALILLFSLLFLLLSLLIGGVRHLLHIK